MANHSNPDVPSAADNLETRNDGDSDKAGAESDPASFSLTRVILALIVILGVSAAGYFLWTVQAGPPALVEYSGRVLYKGEPVTTGGVLTERVDDSLMGAVGVLDQDGRFTLITNGEPGAYVGTHKLAVSAMSSGSPPRPLVPGKYTQPGTTPLRIEVTSDPTRNQGEFVLEESDDQPKETPPSATKTRIEPDAETPDVASPATTTEDAKLPENP